MSIYLASSCFICLIFSILLDGLSIFSVGLFLISISLSSFTSYLTFSFFLSFLSILTHSFLISFTVNIFSGALVKTAFFTKNDALKSSICFWLLSLTFYNSTSDFLSYLAFSLSLRSELFFIYCLSISFLSFGL